MKKRAAPKLPRMAKKPAMTRYFMKRIMGIVIGRKGAMLKEIGQQARKELERFFSARIYLELFVKVRKDWTHDERLLRELGYSDG